MICPKCGRVVPDGTQCPCSSGAPMLSSNPAVNVIKTVGSSTLFMVFALLYSISVVFSIITGMVGDNNLTYSILNQFYELGADPSVLYSILDFSSATSVIGAVLGAIPTILIAIGLWLHYSTSRNTANGGISTTGLTICKVITIIMLVLTCIIVGVAAIIILIAMVASASYSAHGSYYYDSYSGAGTAAIVMIMVIVLIVLAAVLALMIVYNVCTIKTINRIKATAMTGVADNRVPQFLIVMNYIIACSSAVGALFTLFSDPVMAIASLVGAAGTVLITICLSNYKKQMTAVMYAPQSYQQPAYETYAAPQPQVYAQPVYPAPQQEPVPQQAAPVVPDEAVQPYAQPEILAQPEIAEAPVMPEVPVAPAPTLEVPEAPAAPDVSELERAGEPAKVEGAPEEPKQE